jgi:DNA topoisomerase-1
MKKALVIVESPAKAKTISKFLGSGYQVEASFGHVRDLPSTASEIPARFKDQPWARIGVDVDNGFKPLYIVPETKKAQVKKLKSALDGAGEVFLATDEDREGEAIAWHLQEVLDPKVPIRRMVFHEITKTAIDEALAHPRDLDLQLVDAQEARRILDRLYGYEVSPVLWRKVKPRLSAGRVQSVAVRLVVARERLRMKFVQASFWDVDAQLQTAKQERFGARLVELGGRRVASGKDFESETGRLADASNTVLLDEPAAQQLAKNLQNQAFTVVSVAEKPFTQRPYPPFITSTLQQEAARKLRFTAQRTMRVAQGLYENGFITYMRTDSTNLSNQAVTAARNIVTELYGAQYLPDEARTYTKKAKGAQEAHEAIRPAGDTFRTPEQVREELEEDALRLYDLIWKRTVASQMKDAAGQRTSAQLEADGGSQGRAVFSASGKVITFPGFLRAYVEGSDDPEADLEDQERILPALARGAAAAAEKLDAKGHTTQPPARYTEASLIKELEDRGIGRPSTYASILQTIQDRGYVWKKGTALVPTFTAFAVTNLLERHFGELVDYDFTARMETDLDGIAAGDRKAAPWLKEFYFGGGHLPAHPAASDGLRKRIESGADDIDPREICSIPLGTDDEGRAIAVRVGRYGPYLQAGDSDLRANLPEDLPPDELGALRVRELLARSEAGDRVLGQFPATGQNIYLKNGRFGPYVQLGEMAEVPKGKKLARELKPRMASLFPGMKPETLSLHDAVELLSFPKSLGVHPTTGEEVTAQDGKFGPYLKMGSETRSLENHEALRTVDLDRAVTLLAEPKKGRMQRGSRALAEVGAHPRSGAPIKVMPGRFGAYVTDGVLNASVPKGADPLTMSVERAVELLDAREAKLKEEGRDPRAEKAQADKAKAEKTQKKAPKAPAGKKPPAARKTPVDRPARAAGAKAGVKAAAAAPAARRTSRRSASK